MESRIQSQPIVPSEIGATHGRRSRSRTTHFPRNSLSSARARMLARMITSTWETMAKTNVFWSDVWNLEVGTTLMKFFSPTKPRARPPHVCVSAAEEEGKEDRHPDDPHDVKDGGGNHEGPEPLRPVQDEPEP